MSVVQHDSTEKEDEGDFGAKALRAKVQRLVSEWKAGGGGGGKNGRVAKNRQGVGRKKRGSCGFNILLSGITQASRGAWGRVAHMRGQEAVKGGGGD